MKYNYVVLGSSSDLYKFSYSDLRKTNYATYIPGIESKLNKIEQGLLRAHTWRKLNSIVSLPFKGVWNKILLGQVPVRDENKICFIFFSNWVEYDNAFHITDYLRRNYEGCKLVWFLQDIISTRSMIDGSPFDMVTLKDKFDLVISFDQNDCKKYNLHYHHLVFSSFEGVVEDYPESDVYFIGKAKNRLKEILLVYKLLRDEGLKCDFHITGVPESEREYADEIDYDPHISYAQNLQHILHTKCLLEIMQYGSSGISQSGYTQRVCEAVCLNKKLLTNNSEIDNAPFYNEGLICKFRELDDISTYFLHSLKDNLKVDYQYKDKFSPLEFLTFIENLLS